MSQSGVCSWGLIQQQEELLAETIVFAGLVGDLAHRSSLVLAELFG